LTPSNSLVLVAIRFSNSDPVLVSILSPTALTLVVGEIPFSRAFPDFP
jgi:hypothetical protein